MSKKVVFTALLSVVMVLGVSAQDFKKGSLDFLRGQTNVKLVFDFEGVTIDGGSETAYIKERMADEKTPEDAAQWKDDWEGSHRTLFENLFTQYCNDELKNLMVSRTYEDAAYTIIVKIIDIDPGNFGGPFSNPAKLRASFMVVKTGDERNVLNSLTVKNVYNPYGTLQPVEYIRISMGFGQLGKELGEKLNKVLK